MLLGSGSATGRAWSCCFVVAVPLKTSRKCSCQRAWRASSDWVIPVPSSLLRLVRLRLQVQQAIFLHHEAAQVAKQHGAPEGHSVEHAEGALRTQQYAQLGCRMPPKSGAPWTRRRRRGAGRDEEDVALGGPRQEHSTKEQLSGTLLRHMA